MDIGCPSSKRGGTSVRIERETRTVSYLARPEVLIKSRRTNMKRMSFSLLLAALFMAVITLNPVFGAVNGNGYNELLVLPSTNQAEPGEFVTIRVVFPQGYGVEFGRPGWHELSVQNSSTGDTKRFSFGTSDIEPGHSIVVDSFIVDDKMDGRRFYRVTLVNLFGGIKVAEGGGFVSIKTELGRDLSSSVDGIGNTIFSIDRQNVSTGFQFFLVRHSFAVEVPVEIRHTDTRTEFLIRKPLMDGLGLEPGAYTPVVVARLFFLEPGIHAVVNGFVVPLPRPPSSDGLFHNVAVR